MRRSLAFALLVFSALPAAAYVRTTDGDTGVCLFWPRRDLHWTLNEAGTADLPTEQAETALEASFQTWNNASCSDLAFVYDGRTSRSDAGFSPSATDNLNLVVFRDRSCRTVVPAGDPCEADADPFACANAYGCWAHSTSVIALTTTSYNRHIGNVVDADMEFNASASSGGTRFRFTATVDARPVCTRTNQQDCVDTDLENTATHEAGHFLGLSHSPESDATMYASAPIGETSKRTLADDDVSGVCDLYPTGAPPTTCTPSGRIVVAPSSGSTTSGCASAAGGAWLVAALGAVRRRRR
ncbi:MAG: hypothetical protein RL199_1498 [Pseudomonadota bacterium]|jgi:hypothetical protein